MLTAEEKNLLRDYKKAFRSYYQNKEVVDLDKKLPRKPEYFLVRLSEVLPQLAMTIPPTKQSNFTVLYISQGGGEKTIGNIGFMIKERTLIIIPAFTVHSAHYNDDCRGYNLTFNLRFFLQDNFPRHHLLKMELFNSGFTPFAYIDIKYGKQLTEIFETILDEKFHHRKNRDEMIALKILELIILCERLLKIEGHAPKKNFPTLVIKYMEMVREHYKTHHSVGFYAAKLRVHPNQLNANTRKYLDQSAKITIDTMLVQEAEYLLLQTAFSVKEIAYELGFQSASHFFRFFKRYKGVSPAVYRNRVFENAVS